VNSVAGCTGVAGELAFRDRVAAAEIRLIAHLALRRGGKGRAGASIDDIAPVMKIVSTELLQEFTELLLEAAGDRAAGVSGRSRAGAVRRVPLASRDYPRRLQRNPAQHPGQSGSASRELLTP
jgi:hypothetical protein